MIIILLSVIIVVLFFILFAKNSHVNELKKSLQEAHKQSIRYSSVKVLPTTNHTDITSETEQELLVIKSSISEKQKELNELENLVKEKHKAIAQIEKEIAQQKRPKKPLSELIEKHSLPTFTKRFSIQFNKDDAVNLTNTFRYTTEGRRTVFELNKSGSTWFAVDYEDFHPGGLRCIHYRDNELSKFAKDGYVVLCILIWHQYLGKDIYSCDFHAEVYDTPCSSEKLVKSIAFQMSCRSLCPTDETFNYVLELKRQKEEELEEAKKIKGDLYKESKSYMTRLSNRIGDILHDLRPITEDRFTILNKELKDKKKECALLIKTQYYATLASLKGDNNWDKERVSNLAITLIDSLTDRLIENVFANGLEKTKTNLVKIIASVEQLVPYELKFSVPQEYITAKKEQIQMAYEIEVYKRQLKEERTRKLQAEREEREAQREIERELKRAEKDETEAQAKLERRELELVQAKSDAEIKKLKEHIEKLKFFILEAQQRKERALSMAQQTRAGYVYVISNIGSFGEGIYKIGMTRRIEPMIRIVELSDASVPFPFDVHAMMWSEDAPTLETSLHRAFDERKVNAVNGRKEFFRVSLDEIKEELAKLNIEATIIEYPKAAQYRDTNAIRGIT